MSPDQVLHDLGLQAELELRLDTRARARRLGGGVGGIRALRQLVLVRRPVGDHRVHRLVRPQQEAAALARRLELPAVGQGRAQAAAHVHDGSGERPCRPRAAGSRAPATASHRPERRDPAANAACGGFASGGGARPADPGVDRQWQPRLRRQRSDAVAALRGTRPVARSKQASRSRSSSIVAAVDRRRRIGAAWRPWEDDCAHACDPMLRSRGGEPPGPQLMRRAPGAATTATQGDADWLAASRDRTRHPGCLTVLR